MWIRPSYKTIRENRWIEYQKFCQRMQEAQKRIEEKNIKKWDEVIWNRRMNWIVQQKWIFNWNIVRCYDTKHIRYSVDFEINWEKKTYPVIIDEIKKA